MIRFGTGGSPITSKSRKTVDGIARIHELGLEHMELEFVYQVHVDESEVEAINKAREVKDVSLSVHGSYYTNFASEDSKKWHATISRTVKAAKRGDEVGAKSITFHTAFFQEKTVEEVLPRITDGLGKVFTELEDTNIVIAPELTGKPTQFGSIEQLIELVKILEKEGYKDKIKFCIDWAHNHARQNGIFKSKQEYKEFLDIIIEELGESYLKDLHMHMSAIEYSPKGERNHLTLLKSFESYKKDYGIDIPELESTYATLAKKNRLGGGEQDWQGLLEVLKEYEVSGFIVCESPNLEHDALVFKKYYESI